MTKTKKDCNNRMGRKTMTADEIRKQLHLTRQAITNYLNLGILTPVPGTENDAKPSYYADEVAVVSETLTTCESSIKRLNSIRNKVANEIFKTKAALSVLQLDEATKQGAVTSIIDSIALYLNKAVPNLDLCQIPLYWLRWSENIDIDHFMETMCKNRPFRIPQDFCNELYHETEVIDATTLNHVIEERDALEKENEELTKTIDKLYEQLDFLAPDARAALSRYGYGKELTEKQIRGLQKDIFDCDFTVRVLNCLKANCDGDKSITILKDIVKFTAGDLKKFRNFGKNSANEIINQLTKYDLTLGMDLVEIEGIAV